MARPMICRKVSCDVTARYFKPQGIPMRDLEEIAMELDEIEAIRLAWKQATKHQSVLWSKQAVEVSF